MIASLEINRQESSNEPHRRIKSCFLLALGLFVLLNALLSFYAPIQFDAFKFPYKGWDWWTINDLRRRAEVHNVALLGSSLMVSAVAGCDANFLNKNLDLANYHKCSYLDHRLRTTFGGSFDTFNLSAPGQMPSDAYLSLRAMVNCANRPDVVIYGIAPRDLIDSTLSSPADTEPFKYLRRLVNIDDVASILFRSPFAKLDWLLTKVVYLYGSAMDFQLAFRDLSDQLLAFAVPQPYNNPSFTWWDRVRLLPGYMPGEIHPEAVIAGPIDEKTAASHYVDNTGEYLQRYRSPDPHTYKVQTCFLKEIARFCRKERIELVLVNMPITLYNVGMLRPGIYMKYVQAMKELAFYTNTNFYDLSDFNHYKQSDFHDSVHLNAFGGLKFMDSVVAALAGDRRSAMIMAMAGKELEEHKAIAAARPARPF